MPYQHFWLLLLWMVIGTCLRFINLGKLPPWTDESATVVFSLGNSFYNVPLNQFIDLQTLLEPLQLNPNAGIGDVIHLLLTESTHPPLYFVLTHLWLKLFPSEAGLASIWAARSLSALLGVLSIPAIFYFTRLASRSLVPAQIAAAIMAVSPFGIFLATQARHYTLIILLTIASLSCFIVAFRSFDRFKAIPVWLVFVWIAINCIGVATHYFFVLTLAAMAIAFVPLVWRFRQDKSILVKSQWRRIYLVAFGSLMGCLVWLPVLLTIRGRSPTEWIYQSNAMERWLEPIGRFLLWLMSMVILLPTSLYDFSLGIVIFCGIASLLFWYWYLPYLVYAKRHSDGTSGLQTYFIAAIALFFFFTYLGMDLTLAGRFHFVYFPVVITLVAMSLGYFWQDEGSQQPVKYLWSNSIKRSKKIVVIFLSVGLFSGTIALFNLGYLQNHRPDLAIAQIVEGTRSDIAIATTYKHHGQTGRIIGLAWGLKNLPNIHSPQFFLAGEREILSEELSKIDRPLDLWLINFRDEIELEAQNCFPDFEYRGMTGQYKYELYRCQRDPAVRTPAFDGASSDKGLCTEVASVLYMPRRIPRSKHLAFIIDLDRRTSF